MKASRTVGIIMIGFMGIVAAAILPQPLQPEANSVTARRLFPATDGD